MNDKIPILYHAKLIHNKYFIMQLIVTEIGYIALDMKGMFTIAFTASEHSNLD